MQIAWCVDIQLKALNIGKLLKEICKRLFHLCLLLMTDVVLDDTQGCALVSDFTNDLQKQSRIPEITGNVNGKTACIYNTYLLSIQHKYPSTEYSI